MAKALKAARPVIRTAVAMARQKPPVTGCQSK
jgi:hypothetical protein